jgi:predicted ATPase
MSGAPGSGKTAVIERLRDDVRVVTEPARAILAEQRASGGTGTWDQDVALFVRLLLERAVADHQRARMRGGITVFDRGIPDCVVYADRAGVDRSSSVDASITYRYEREVLFFEPWREIYTTDDERTLDFDGAAAFGEDLMNEYSRCGYSIVTVPKVSVADRVAFVHARIDTPAN